MLDIPVSSLWHERLGHLSKVNIMHLSRARYIPKLSFSDHQFCEHCQYPTSAPRELSPLDLVHSDVCGPMPHQSLGGASYFVNFIDDSMRKVWAYPIRTNHRVFSIFSDWLTTEVSSNLKNSSNLAENAASDVNTRHLIVRSRTESQNA